MLRIVICCGGGMSSSVLSSHMKETIKEAGMEDKITIEYLPLIFLPKRQDQFDIAMLCPHLRYYAQDMVRKGITVPMYIIPSCIYGTMDIYALLEDAVDILKLYKETGMNPIHFPEESFLETKRNISHRRWIKKHPAQTQE